MTAISQDRPANTSLVQRGIREALYAGAISFGMFFLLIGLIWIAKKPQASGGGGGGGAH